MVPPMKTCCRQLTLLIFLTVFGRPFVLDGYPVTQPPCQKGGAAPPQFSAHFYCGQTAGCIKMPLGTEVGPSPKKGADSPKFSANVYFGQTAGWIEMVLDMDVGLSPGEFVPLSPIAGNPSNTKWPGPRFTSVPSGVIIHLAVWPQ